MENGPILHSPFSILRLERLLLRRSRAPAAAGRTHALLHVLRERQQAIALEWQRELRHDGALQRGRDWRELARHGVAVVDNPAQIAILHKFLGAHTSEVTQNAGQTEVRTTEKVLVHEISLDRK